MNIYRAWLLVKRDYRLPIAKRFGPTAARTFDTNAEIVTIGVRSVFRLFDIFRNLRSRPRVDCSSAILSTSRYTFTSDRPPHTLQTLEAILSTFAVIFIYRMCAREHQFTILNADFPIGVDVQLEMSNRDHPFNHKRNVYIIYFLEFYQSI